MYKYPENMRRIEKIAAKARAEGKSYGEYVSTMELPPVPMVMPRRKGRNPKCTKCGAEITNPGKGHRKLCDACRSDILSKAKRAAAENKGEYHRQCTRCGADVITKQSPSKSRNGNLYCTACRAELNRIRKREWYDRQKEKEKNDD